MGIIHSEKSNMVDQTAARNECVTNLESLYFQRRESGVPREYSRKGNNKSCKDSSPLTGRRKSVVCFLDEYA